MSLMKTKPRRTQFRLLAILSPVVLALVAGGCTGRVTDVTTSARANPVTVAAESATAQAATAGLVGYWPFESSLADASGTGRNADGEAPRFAPGKQGMALAPNGQAVTLPDAPELQLAPGFRIDCWVYWDKKPEGYEEIVKKDTEYMLRVDSQGEGGRFAFFAYLDGWEPRVRGPAPEPGQWYHVVAQWTGNEAILEVNGVKATSAHAGIPAPTENPVRLGGITGRLDELRLFNPMALCSRHMAALAAAVPAAERLTQTHFGSADGWQGWQALGGATLAVSGGQMSGKLDAPYAWLVNPKLNVEVTRCRYVCVDLDAAGCEQATLSFITDRGASQMSFPLWGGTRTSIVDLSSCPQWGGILKSLALALPGDKTGAMVVDNVWIAGQPAGRPFVYLRSLAPGRAALRAGREEQVLAVVRSLGAPATNVRVRLIAPPGLTLLDDAARTIVRMDRDTTEPAQWRVQAQKPMDAEVTAELTADGFAPVTTALQLRFTAPLDLPKADYVPEPKPAPSKYLTLMHYCQLWKEGTHYGWGKIEPWPERRPAIGWYDEGTPEVADWHIKMAVEHGVQGFIYCWYRAGLSAEIRQSIGHALHDGMLKARYLDRFKFIIMWENGCASGCKDRDDLLNNLMPYWMTNYFKNPSYMKIDNKPVLFIWVPGNVSRDLGAPDKVREAFELMRAACRKEGFDGLTIVGCVASADKGTLERMAAEGWDASSAYGIASPTDLPPARDIEGIRTTDHASSLLGQEKSWRGKKEIGALPDIVDVMMGWDPRPWHGSKTSSYLAGATPAHFKAACERAKALVDATPGKGLDKRLVVFDNWNEFGEGHFLEPCSGFGFGFLDAIKDVFCEGTPPCQDITPADVGLPYPERAYLKRREILGGLEDRQRQVLDNLVGWWRFEEDDADIARDSSACEFHGWKQDAGSAPGKSGKGLLCQGGSVTIGPNKLFWPDQGISVELWLKTDVPNQSDRWMVNTVGRASTGYRLGFGDGKVCWQIPKTAWSHGVTSPQPVALGTWTHVVATYDNQTLRLYIDGAETATLERGGPIAASGSGLCLGNFTGGHQGAFFQGVMDEVKLFDRALTAAEVAAHYASAGK